MQVTPDRATLLAMAEAVAEGSALDPQSEVSEKISRAKSAREISGLQMRPGGGSGGKLNLPTAFVDGKRGRV
jgi:hypothetical protein